MSRRVRWPCPDHGEPPVVRPSPLGDDLVAAVCPVPGCEVSGYSARTEAEAREAWDEVVSGKAWQWPA